MHVGGSRGLKRPNRGWPIFKNSKRHWQAQGARPKQSAHHMHSIRAFAAPALVLVSQRHTYDCECQALTGRETLSRAVPDAAVRSERNT